MEKIKIYMKFESDSVEKFKINLTRTIVTRFDFNAPKYKTAFELIKVKNSDRVGLSNLGKGRVR